jgi:hypothetical protein
MHVEYSGCRSINERIEQFPIHCKNQKNGSMRYTINFFGISSTTTQVNLGPVWDCIEGFKSTFNTQKVSLKKKVFIW